MHLNASLTTAVLGAPGLTPALCLETSSQHTVSPPLNPMWQAEEKLIPHQLTTPTWNHYDTIWQICLHMSTTEPSKECKGILQIIKWDYDEGKIWLCLKYDLTPSPQPSAWCLLGERWRQTRGSGRSGAQQGVLDRRSSKKHMVLWTLTYLNLVSRKSSLS